MRHPGGVLGGDRWKFFGVAAAALAAVVLLALDPGGWFGRTDEAIARWFVGRRTSGWTSFFRAATDLGDGMYLTPVGAVVVVLLVRRPPRAWAAAATFAGANLSATTLNRVVKGLVDRPRPPQAHHLVFVDSPSFPSGHAAQAAAFWGGLAILVLLSDRSARLKVAATSAAIAAVLVVAVSRVYLGVHWTSDVAASCLLTTAWFAFLAGARLSFGKRRTGRGPTAPTYGSARSGGDRSRR